VDEENGSLSWLDIVVVVEGAKEELTRPREDDHCKLPFLVTVRFAPSRLMFRSKFIHRLYRFALSTDSDNVTCLF
jgi:hypothetical protein